MDIFDNRLEKERVLLVAIYPEAEEIEDALKELSLLARTAGGEVVFECSQRLDKPVGATMAGSGKLLEIAELVKNHEIDTVIFDNELSGVQLRNIERETGAKILDRSSLILDIFAQRAKSLEGRLQVELAQLKYNMPRLIGSGGVMSKMRAGIGMRGPGETKLETDRRIIKRRIFELEERIKKLADERELRRGRRTAGAVKSVALVGYTNAGKSTILNYLAKEKAFAEDMLFATLDPLTRRVHVEGNRFYVITDTVGFINRLPHTFIDAFASTLEEAARADILLLVLDASSEKMRKEYEVVLEVLGKLKINDKEIITVYNKIDKDSKAGAFAYQENGGAIAVSAKRGDNMEGLREIIEKNLFGENLN